MILRNWLRRFVPGDPVCKVADTTNLNRIANVLEDIEVIGSAGISAQIDKPTAQEGIGWTIHINGAQLGSLIPSKELPTVGEGYALLSLSGYGATASQTEWKIGDKDANGRLYLPLLRYQYRLYWDAPNHQLLYFQRDVYYNQDGICCKISKESTPQAVFTSMPENF